MLSIEKRKLLKDLNIEDDDEKIEKEKPPSINTEIDDNPLNQFECSVPYRFQNGHIEYHDALVIVEDDENNGEHEHKVRLKVRIIRILFHKS